MTFVTTELYSEYETQGILGILPISEFPKLDKYSFAHAFIEYIVGEQLETIEYMPIPI